MFEFLKKLAPSAKTRQDDASSDVVFWVDMPKIPAPPTSQRCVEIQRTRSVSPNVTASISDRLGSHRERLLAMQLEHLKLCPPKRSQQLASLGVHTAGDLVFGDLKKIASSFESPSRAERAIRRYRAAIRLAASVDSMMPRDALLLVSIHRRSVASLSRESAAQLHRDLERFSLSTRGSKIIGRRSVPSLRRVKAWVATCRQIAESATMKQPAMSC